MTKTKEYMVCKEGGSAAPLPASEEEGASTGEARERNPNEKQDAKSQSSQRRAIPAKARGTTRSIDDREAREELRREEGRSVNLDLESDASK